MTDLTAVLPSFPIDQYVRLLPSLEKHRVTTADLLTLDGLEVAKRAQLPILDVKRLCRAVLEALQCSLNIADLENGQPASNQLKKTGEEIVNGWQTISTLDDDFDHALGGGIPTRSITEVTGESGVGKTQFLLTLLLAVQLAPPYGLFGAALYISTESALPVTRLRQLLISHPLLSSTDHKPSLDKIISIVTPDLESQDHILRFQVPVAVRRHGVRLLILDSVAANYRAEFERGTNGVVNQKNGVNMAQRSSELAKLGQLLRDLAREMDIAVVVANQVADRFSNVGGSHGESAGGKISNAYRGMQSSPLARRSGGALPPLSSSQALPMSSIPREEEILPSFRSSANRMSLDHQQRWFTGWGDDPHPSHLTNKSMKTPSLGLVWTNQIACRIALIKRPVYGPGVIADEENEMGEPVLRRWRRWMKVVFAAHAGESGPGLVGAVPFEIKGQGIAAVTNGKEKIDEADYEDNNDSR